MPETTTPQYVLCVISGRLVHKRMALYIDGVQANGLAVRVLAIPRGKWCLAKSEASRVVSRWGWLSIDMGSVKHAKLASVMCFHWFMLPLAVIIGLACRKPVLYDEYDHFEINQLEGNGSWLKRRFFSLLVQWIHRICLPWVSLVTCIHMDKQTLKRHLEKWQPSILEIHNYPVSEWRESGQARSPAGKLCFVYIGCVYAEKGVGAAAEAFQSLPESARKTSELHIFGEGDADLISRLRTMPGVTVHNRVTPAQFREFTATHRCCGLALLANTPRYNLVGTNCRKFYEYLALGMPLIATRVGEFPQFVGEHGVGLLIDGDLNVGQLIVQMQRLSEDQSLFEQYARNALDLMSRDEMTWEHEWSRIEQTGIITCERRAA